MSWIAVAASVAGNVLGASISSDAASNAANVQQQGTQAALGEQQREFDVQQKNNAPFLQTGTAATQRLSTLLGLNTGSVPWQPGMPTPAGAQSLTQWAQAQGYDLPVGRDWDSRELANLTPGYQAYLNQYSAANPSTAASADPAFGSLTRKFTTADLNADPVYQSGLQFGLDQGTGAINARNIANGTGFDSGATLKQLVKYANDYGSTKASDSYNRFVNDQNNLYAKMSGQQSSGQTAVSTIGQLGSQNASNISNLITGGANAGAAGIVGGANAWNGAFSGIGGVINNAQNTALLKQLVKNQTPGGGSTFNSSAPSTNADWVDY